MHQSTEEALKFFAAGHVNWMSPDNYDIERFYQFVIAAYRNADTAISTDDFTHVFESCSNSTLWREDLDEWVTRYQQGLALLKVSDQS